MAIESRTAVSNTQLVLSKHDVEPAGGAGHSKKDGQREQAKREQRDTGRHPIPNAQGQLTGVIIDVTV